MIYYQKDDERGGTALGVVCAVLAVCLVCGLRLALAFFAIFVIVDMAATGALILLCYFAALGAAWYGSHRFLLFPRTVQVTERGMHIARDYLPWPRRREELIMVERRRLVRRPHHRAVYNAAFGRVRMRGLENMKRYDDPAVARRAVEARLDEVWAACERAREDAAQHRRQAAAEPDKDAQK
ncbi:hypothetical protein [Actinomyces ruminis]|uniref:Integral membrane protein n=1 Tax=Actinomyces ruminis TaxID=1937003 RepID=A0ABX4ME10_9ACTO|nr:hypothetical protein [Actinomyces ruminis]PHP53687.1 hypothetical protein BW737_000940 [Actinomyces ruminis]